MSEEFDFERFKDEFDAMKIMYQEMAKITVPMFQSYIEQGLTIPEAAALTAAMIAHTLPTKSVEPQED